MGDEGELDAIIETARRIVEMIKPLGRWEQQVALDMANSIREYRWVTHSIGVVQSEPSLQEQPPAP